MPNDMTLPRFLYAILKQKALKDIDWVAVCLDPVLEEPISTVNKGQAARMRWSRFRDNMKILDGTTPAPKPRRPRSPNSPRRSRVQKNKSPKKEQRKLSQSPEDIKFESTPEMTPDVFSRRGTSAPVVKSEVGRYSEMPATPPPPAQPQLLSYIESPAASPSPGQSQSQSFGHVMPDLEDPMMHLFSLLGYDMHMPMISGGVYGTGLSPIGMGMGMGTPSGELFATWTSDGLPHLGADAGTHVKKEPTWDEPSYRL